MLPSGAHNCRVTCPSCQVDESGLPPLGLDWGLCARESRGPLSVEQPLPPGRMVSPPCGPRGHGWFLPPWCGVYHPAHELFLYHMASSREHGLPGSGPCLLICSPHTSKVPGPEWGTQGGANSLCRGLGQTLRCMATSPWGHVRAAQRSEPEHWPETSDVLPSHLSPLRIECGCHLPPFICLENSKQHKY